MKTQILRFLIVGGVSTAINYAVFMAVLYLDRFLYLFASCSGYIAGLLVGFFANRNWTFESGGTGEKYLLRYFLVYGSSLLISLVILHLLVNYVGVWPEIANGIAICVSTVTNFIGVKLFVFRK
jgi:putative flippase GtrA